MGSAEIIMEIIVLPLSLYCILNGFAIDKNILGTATIKRSRIQRNFDVFLQGPVLDNVYCVNTTCRLDSSASMID